MTDGVRVWQGTLGARALFRSDEGPVLGPVGPTWVEMRPEDGDHFTIGMSFDLSNDSGQVLSGERAEFAIATIVRHPKIRRTVLSPSDTLTIAYDLHCRFLDDDGPSWTIMDAARRLLGLRTS